MGVACFFSAIDFEKISQFKKDPGLIPEYLFPDNDEEPPNSTDVDKAFHCIHFILTGKSEGGDEPLSLVIFGGEEVGEDIGYGPVKILLPEQVKAISKSLNEFGVNEFKVRYQPELLEKEQIYPEGLWMPDDQNIIEYVLGNFEKLVSFYNEAAKRGDGALLYLA
jgi:hypothetical protein